MLGWRSCLRLLDLSYARAQMQGFGCDLLHHIAVVIVDHSVFVLKHFDRLLYFFQLFLLLSLTGRALLLARQREVVCVDCAVFRTIVLLYF